uniref:Uncharacterized protein n=1 Tax=Manihot esculenta TaxID=3983 RepID=A0A2C9V795_MANES
MLLDLQLGANIRPCCLNSIRTKVNQGFPEVDCLPLESQ